jgi:hypothetical protein
MISRILFALSLAAPLAAAACTDTVEDEFLDDDVVDVDDSKSDIAGGTYTFFSVARDMRRCASPYCGGYWIKRLNASTTKCFDGRYADQCYVPTVDTSRMGLGEAALEKVNGAINGAANHNFILLRGVMASKQWEQLGTFGEFRVSEAWLGQGPNAGDGPFAMAEDTGVRCFTYPCNSIREKKLNSSASAYLADIGWDASGASDEAIGLAAQKLVDDAVIIAGDRYNVSGPGGRGKARYATNFYLKAVDEASSATCMKTGCSGQVCADHSVITTCEFRPEYACYRDATCEVQADGYCGWTETAALDACLANPPQE